MCELFIQYHTKCVNLERTEGMGTVLWHGLFCTQSILPYNLIFNDDEYTDTAGILENIMSCPTSLEDINNKSFVQLEINDSDSPLSETDPDVQFKSKNHYIISTFCDYYFKDYLNSMIGNKCGSTNVTSTWISRASRNIIMNWKYI